MGASTIGIGLYYLLDILAWAIVIRSIMTWFPNEITNKLYNMLGIIIDPIEAPIRSVMYKYSNGPVDFSPMVAILLLMLLKRVVLFI